MVTALGRLLILKRTRQSTHFMTVTSFEAKLIVRPPSPQSSLKRYTYHHWWYFLTATWPQFLKTVIIHHITITGWYHSTVKRISSSYRSDWCIYKGGKCYLKREGRFWRWSRRKLHQEVFLTISSVNIKTVADDSAWIRVENDFPYICRHMLLQ